MYIIIMVKIKCSCCGIINMMLPQQQDRVNKNYIHPKSLSYGIMLKVYNVKVLLLYNI